MFGFIVGRSESRWARLILTNHLLIQTCITIISIYINI